MLRHLVSACTHTYMHEADFDSLEIPNEVKILPPRVFEESG